MKKSLLTAVFLGLIQWSAQVGRRLAPKNIVEVYFVVDYKAFQIYLNEEYTPSAAKASMEADIDYFLTEVNKLFKSLDNVNVIISKRKLDIIQDSSVWIFPPSIVQQTSLVSATRALSAFDVWLSDKTLDYDLALLWTGYDVFNVTTTTAGYAWMGTVCEGQKTSSVVEYDGTYSTVVNTAHEIAHNLGAGHDSAATGYVMSPKASPTSVNRWRFSTCSSSDIIGNFKEITKNCMTSTNPASVIPQSAVTRRLSDPEALCVRKYGHASFFCRSPNFYEGSVPKGDEMCKAFYCSVGGNKCSSVISSDGLLCGAGKTCKQGICQIDPTSQTRDKDENCLYGDQKSITSWSGTFTCPEFLDKNGDDYCSQESVLNSCCQSCRERRTSDPSCPYGDRNKDCSKYSRSQICGSYPDICCKSCRGYRGRRSTNGILLDIALDQINRQQNALVPMKKAKQDPVVIEETRKSHQPLLEL